RVREIRKLVRRFENARGVSQTLFDIAIVPCRIARLLRERSELREQLFRATAERCRLVPFDRERIARLLRAPEIAREHGHTRTRRRLESDDRFHALHRFGLRRIEALERRAETRRMDDDG